MSEQINVGRADSIIRIILGIIILGIVAYHFIGDPILPIYGLIPAVILIPFFLKTGVTKVCPIMKAMNISTTKKP